MTFLINPFLMQDNQFSLLEFVIRSLLNVTVFTRSQARLKNFSFSLFG